MSGGSLLVLGVVWPLAGGLAPLPGAAALAQGLTEAGVELVPVAQAADRLRQGLEPPLAGVSAVHIDRLRQGLVAGAEAFLHQDYGVARAALQAALDDSSPWLGQATRKDPELLADYLRGAVTLVRTLKAMGAQRDADRLLQAIAFRFPELRLTEAEVPRPLLVRLAEAQRRLALRVGALDVALAGDLPPDVERCGVYLNGVLRGYPPLRLDAVYTGSYRVVVLCPGRRPTRPLRVEVGEGRKRLLVVLGGDEQLRLGPQAQLGVRLAPGWSGPGPVPPAGLALAARSGAAGAMLVGYDAAFEGLRVRLVWLEGSSPAGGLSFSNPEDAVALVEGRSLVLTRGPSPAARGLLWTAAGLASGALLAAGLAGWSYRSFGQCQQRPGCEPSGALVEHQQAVERFALTADVLFISALVAGVGGWLLWGDSDPEPSP